MKDEVEQGRVEKRSALIVLTDDLIKRLDAEAQRQTSSRSLIVRLACESFLQQVASREAA